MTADDTPWQAAAACAGQPFHVFFPPERAGIHAYDRARTICANCSVRQQCLDDALDDGWQHAMRGGLTPVERQALKRSTRRQAS